MPEFIDNLTGLLGTPQARNFATGLLAQSGYTNRPTTFGQAVAGAQQYATDRESAALDMEMRRQRIQQAQQRQSALKQLPGLLTNNAPAGIRAPQGLQQERIMGLLGQIAPEQMAQGLLQQMTPQQPNLPTAAEEFLFAQGLPPEQQQAFSEWANPGPSALETAQLQNLMLDTQNLIDERRREITNEKQETEILKIGIDAGIKDMVKLFDVNNELEDTFLQSGIPFSEGRRALSGGLEAIRGAFGMDSELASKLNSNHDLFKKISNDFAAGTIERLGGTSTNFRLQSTIDANANLAAAPPANRFVIASNLMELLAQARAQGIEVPEADRRAAQKIIDSVFTSNVVDLNDLPE